MSNSSWQENLKQTLPALTKAGNHIAIVGVGHPLRGDDSAGLSVIEELQKLSLPDEIHLIDTGAVPESCTGLLRKIQPELVLIFDAAQMDIPAGDCLLIQEPEVELTAAITHGIPIKTVCQYIKREFQCRVWLIGIQPGQNDLFNPISAPVQRAVTEISQVLQSLYPSPLVKTIS